MAQKWLSLSSGVRAVCSTVAGVAAASGEPREGEDIAGMCVMPCISSATFLVISWAWSMPFCVGRKGDGAGNDSSSSLMIPGMTTSPARCSCWGCGDVATGCFCFCCCCCCCCCWEEDDGCDGSGWGCCTCCSCCGDGDGCVSCGDGGGDDDDDKTCRAFVDVDIFGNDDVVVVVLLLF